MKYPFDAIVETKDIYLVIDKHFPDGEEKEYLVTIIKDTFHHNIVDLVLDELDSDQRMMFLAVIENEEDHPTLLERLREWIVDFEYKVAAKVRETELEILKTLGLSD